jgi:hypothetical protein
MNVGFGAGASIGSLQTQQFLAVGLFLCPCGQSLYADSCFSFLGGILLHQIIRLSF